jgi:hypothetical protein
MELLRRTADESATAYIEPILRYQSNEEMRAACFRLPAPCKRDQPEIEIQESQTEYAKTCSKIEKVLQKQRAGKRRLCKLWI